MEVPIVKIIKIGENIFENIPAWFQDEEGNQIWNVPSDLNVLKQALIDTVKWQAHQELKKTDWVVVKLAETGQLGQTTQYDTVLQKRQQIRDWANQKEQEIQDCQTVDELLALDIKLPDNLRF